MRAADAGGDRPTRLRVALLFALVTGAYAAARVAHEPHWPTDFDQIHFAARAILAGRDPYALVGPGREFPWNWPFYYPLPAALLALPFAPLPIAIARVAFATLAGGVLGWAAGARARYLWPILLSAALLIATSRAQWAPLLLAAAWLPWLGVVVAAKPNVGLASFAAHRDRRQLAIGIAGAACITLAAFAIQPSWFVRWREAVSESPHVIATVLHPWGWLLLLASLRWRRPEARLFLALVCLPHTPSLYDLLPLFFVCRTLRQALLLALLTHVLFWGWVNFGSANTFELYARRLGELSLFVVFLPLLVVILRRPNVASDGEPEAEVTWLGWRKFAPATRVDAVLLALLLVPFAFLVWLPLVTYR